MRERAIRQGFRLNEYGLFPEGAQEDQTPGAAPVAARTEEEVYEALGMPWIPPELREDRGELGLEGTPSLIDLDDVRAELHAHTDASDGHLTIEDLAAEAKRRGFHTIAITDHSRSSALANGLDAQRLRRHVQDIRRVARRFRGISILAGSEVDILADGRLDYDDQTLRALDLVVASPHVALRQDPDHATRRLVAAIRHPAVRILGHPTGRLINRREGLSPDMKAVIAAAVECGVALEINANSWRLDLRDTHVRAAVEAGALLAIDTDAHSAEDFDQLRYGVLTARRGWLPPQQCLNTWSRQKLRAWLARRRT
jgi:DNA polymerase (family 10)